MVGLGVKNLLAQQKFVVKSKIVTFWFCLFIYFSGSKLTQVLKDSFVGKRQSPSHQLFTFSPGFPFPWPLSPFMCHLLHAFHPLCIFLSFYPYICWQQYPFLSPFFFIIFLFTFHFFLSLSYTCSLLSLLFRCQARDPEPVWLPVSVHPTLIANILWTLFDMLTGKSILEEKTIVKGEHMPHY